MRVFEELQTIITHYRFAFRASIETLNSLNLLNKRTQITAFSVSTGGFVDAEVWVILRSHFWLCKAPKLKNVALEYTIIGSFEVLQAILAVRDIWISRYESLQSYKCLRETTWVTASVSLLTITSMLLSLNGKLRRRRLLHQLQHAQTEKAIMKA